MLDVEPVIVGELGRLSPLDLEQRGDWAAVLVAAAPRRRRRAVAVRAGIVVAAALAVAVPAVAFRDRKSTRLNSSHTLESRMPSSA